MPETQKLLSVSGLGKTFGSVTALEGVTFDLEPGEILGVVGHAGSGKSTLFKLLSGAQMPSMGEMTFAGRRVINRNPAQARELGIETALQDPHLVDTMNVLRNIFLNRETCLLPGLNIWPREGLMADSARRLLADFDLPPELILELPGNLSNEQRQVVAISRALCRTCKLLLLDDVLAALNFQRQQRLLVRIKELSAEGVAVILSSDDLNHIFSVTDRILVLFHGRQLTLRPTSEITPREVVELIVGSSRQEQVTPVIWAFENYYAAQKQADELRLAQQALRQSLKAQDSLNRQLIERMNAQMESLDRLNLALQEANRRLMTEREAERKALARDLHDQVIQDLLSFIYRLEETENDISEQGLSEELADIRSGIRNVISSLRETCSDLRPPTIDSHGLSAAIRSLMHQWEKQSGIHVELSIDAGLGRLPETIELSVFRIIQEGLRNVRKHANATQVSLALKRTPNASLVVSLADNGQGIVKPINLGMLSEEKHFGLVGISERVSLLGGSMQVDSSGSGGLELQIEIPSPSPIITTGPG